MKDQVPDVRLAQAFGFAVDDLAANRSGFMTLRQGDAIETFLAQGWNRLISLVTKDSKRKKMRQNVQAICGRAHLEHYVVDRNPNQRSKDFYEYFTLKLENYDGEFRLNRKQFDVLSERVVYRVYYVTHDNQRILSIERVYSCND